MKDFIESDVREHGAIAGAGVLNADRGELVLAPTEWQKRGLSETRTGYGARLNSGFKVSYCGKLRRVYVTCYGNAGSSWFKVKGRTIFIH